MVVVVVVVVVVVETTWPGLQGLPLALRIRVPLPHQGFLSYSLAARQQFPLIVFSV
jgi:hypothetical protein